MADDDDEKDENPAGAPGRIDWADAHVLINVAHHCGRPVANDI